MTSKQATHNENEVAVVDEVLTLPDWLAPVTAELKRIKGRHAQKKRTTLLKLVEAELFSRKMNWADTAVCTHSIWYGKWQHDPLMQEVREKVYELIADSQMQEAATAVHRASMILKMGSVTAAQKLVDLADGAESESTQRLAAKDVLNMASAETAEKGRGLNLNADQLAILLADADRELEEWTENQPEIDISQVTKRLPGGVFFGDEEEADETS